MFTTVSPAEKTESVTSLGADALLDDTRDDLVAAVADWTEGRSVNHRPWVLNPGAAGRYSSKG